jgi:UDP-N-acetylglucosamine--N-acetylmuramyl-(pentapeptide) pyrophosphoryl-undecaprenol N-acetylglucosamine transferase
MSDALSGRSQASVVAVFSGGGTGGHLYPALALAGALTEIRPDVRPFFVGASRGLEARVLPEQGVEHLLLPVEGFRRDALLANVRVVRVLLQALTQLAAAFRSLHPRLVVVTGGYAGGPAGLMAVLTGTRLVLQEQNSVPGVTTRVLSLFAREVHLAFPEARRGLPAWSRRKARVTGNPVRPPGSRDREGAARTLGLDPSRPVVLVVGGSQGSLALNRALLEAVAGVREGRHSRPGDFQLLWATGPGHLDAIRDALAPHGVPGWLRVVGYLNEMPLALSVADLAVSRAGAMATSEFLAWGVPAILVPLPTAAADHQTRNALALAEAGAALHLPEGELSGESLWRRIAGIMEDSGAREAMVRAALERGRPHAAREIAGALDALLPPFVPRRQAPRRTS